MYIGFNLKKTILLRQRSSRVMVIIIRSTDMQSACVQISKRGKLIVETTMEEYAGSV